MCGLILDKSSEDKLFNYIKHSLNYTCVSRFSRLVLLQNISKLPSLNLFKKMYLERWFTAFVETECFLRLDYASVHKLLSSSKLRITSEVQVFNAADAWVRYDIETRKQYAKTLLLQVRFPLLSDSAISHLLSKNSSFKLIDICCSIGIEFLSKKIKFLHNSENFYTNRYCTQSISTSNLLINENSVFYKSNIYSFYNKYNLSYINITEAASIEKYSFASNKFEKVAVLPNSLEQHTYFSLCVLI